MDGEAAAVGAAKCWRQSERGSADWEALRCLGA